MAHEEVRHAGVFRPSLSRRARTSFTTYFHPSFSPNQPYSEGAAAVRPVAQVVVARHGEAVPGQEAGKAVIALHMLRDAVDQLHHPPGPPSGSQRRRRPCGPRRWKKR